MSVPYNLILNSQGLGTNIGVNLIKKALNFIGKSLETEKILLVSDCSEQRKRVIVEGGIRLGIPENNMIWPEDLRTDSNLISDVEAVYVDEGNVFGVLDYIRKMQVEKEIRQIVLSGGVYIGSSAGAMMAGDDIVLGSDFDKNKALIQDLNALRLFTGTIIPHYSYADLKQYKKNIDSELLRQYENIYSVDENEVLVLNVKDGDVKSKKRFRL